MATARRPIPGRVKAPKKRGEPSEDTIIHLSKAIDTIHRHDASSLSFEEHYRYAYYLVVHKQGHVLYNKVAELIAANLEKLTKEKIVPLYPPTASSIASGSKGADNIVAASDGQLFLTQLREVWNDHIACMSKLRDVLKYMDKVYTGSNSLPSTWDLGLSLFLHHVILYSTDPTIPLSKPSTPISRHAPAQPSGPLPTSNPATVAHQLISTLLTQIRIEREGEPVSRSTLRNATEMLCELTDEGAIPLPITASTGIGAGSPVMGVGSGGASGRGRPVMGEGMHGERESPYKTSFEKAFLKQTEEFYRVESAALLIECDAPTFLKRIERRLEEELDRSQTYLSSSTEPLLITLLEKTLITAHLSAILSHSSSGLSTLVLDSRNDDLQRLYRLFGRVAMGHAKLQEGISKWIVETGRGVNEGVLFANRESDAIVDEKGKGKAIASMDEVPMDSGGAASKVVAKPKPTGTDVSSAKTKAALGWVQSVLDLKDKFDVLLKQAFSSDKAFEKSINDAFTVFVNQNPKSPEYISLFVDENLKKGLKGKTEAEVDTVLNKTIVVFRFLSEKDVFEKYYNYHLARRLVYGRSVSDDAERGMLAKFKIEAGAAFTKSAEGMMKDVKISEDMQGAYKRYQASENGVKAGFDMNVIVCSSNNWSISNQNLSCTLPEVLIRGTESFTAFYNSKHSGRILTFHSEFGSVDVKVKFANRTHEINLSTHSMVVLSLFENLGDEALSYSDIASATSVVPAELKRTLQTLACAKYKLLSKSPKGREVNETDSFSFNDAFSCPLAKIRLQTVVNKIETAEESKETDTRIDESRNLLCEACIVRVMKDRRRLLLNELTTEVIRILSNRFQPKPALIKQAIERMIDKEYIVRDADDRKVLIYLA